MPVTLVIADETPIVRVGLRAIAESGNTNKVVAEASEGLEALFQVEKFKPNILITNLTLARLNGLELIRQVCHLHPETKVIALSNFVNSADLAAVFKCGAQGFINLSSSVSDIQKAIQDVHAGKRHLAPVGVQAILSSISAQGEATAADVILDLAMPNVDGVELLKAVREHWDSVPVIVHTAYSNTHLMKRAMEYSPFTLLSKPSEMSSLLRTVRCVSLGIEKGLDDETRIVDRSYFFDQKAQTRDPLINGDRPLIEDIET